MGVDTRLSLPSKACVQDVANALGVLFGCEVQTRPSHGYLFKHIPDVVLSSSSVVGLVSIQINTPTQGPRSFLFHFEGDGPAPFDRTMLPRATAANIALCKRLADIFGGVVDFNDSDAEDYNYFRPIYEHLGASDGAPWKALQDRIFDAKPLTPEEVEACEPFAAYPGVTLHTQVNR